MITPKDIEIKEFKKVPLGYSAEEVDIFLDAVYVDFERLYRENTALNKKLASVSSELEKLKKAGNPPQEAAPAALPTPQVTDKSLEKILDLAEAVALETKEAARKAADDIILSAEEEAVRIQRDAKVRAEDDMALARNKMFELEQAMKDLEKRYELMRTRVKLLLYAEIELLEKNEIIDKYEGQNHNQVKLG